jgi:hypothetical protein
MHQIDEELLRKYDGQNYREKTVKSATFIYGITYLLEVS